MREEKGAWQIVSSSVSPGQGFPTYFSGFPINFNREKAGVGGKGAIKEEKLREQKRTVVGPQEGEMDGVRWHLAFLVLRSQWKDLPLASI